MTTQSRGVIRRLYQRRRASIQKRQVKVFEDLKLFKQNVHTWV